jgi:hypothetical protein
MPEAAKVRPTAAKGILESLFKHFMLWSIFLIISNILNGNEFQKTKSCQINPQKKHTTRKSVYYYK